MKTLFATCLILIATTASAGETAAPAKLPPGHVPINRTTDLGDIKVAKAVGANAQTVAEIIVKRAELKDQPVMVRGKVVKFNPQIMGKNWLHLRDGTGSAADGSNDILVTTMASAKVGDIVTVQGIVRADKDFGSGYSYQVLIEEATLKP
jgi:DNA/RNA endonuclease YhcR with UshA esterase domain